MDCRYREVVGSIFFVLIVNISILCAEISTHAITYQGGDRFGDRALCYAHARYFSYVTSVPFLYRPFCYSDQISIEYDAMPYEKVAPYYQHRFVVTGSRTLREFFVKIRDPNTPPTLFVIDYFGSDFSEWRAWQILINPWFDPGFSSYLKKCFAPKFEVLKLRKEGRLNVADHVRTLSAGDTVDTSIALLPLKHPNLEYHRRQIRKVYEWNLRKPLHVFLFSDTKNPWNLVADFRREFAGCDITFDIQILDRPDTDHVLQDFYAMQEFDVLIATQSNFSMMAWRVAPFDLVIYPVRVIGEYPNSEIDTIRVISRKSHWFPYDFDITLKEEELSKFPKDWFPIF